MGLSAAPNGYGEAVDAYFRRKAPDYDKADLQPYWRLSDAVLWALLEHDVLVHQPHDLRLLDAGAGTGRWALQVLHARPAAHAVLVDRSADMLAQATAKIKASDLEARTIVGRTDLDVPDALAAVGAVDLAICFHNVLGFVRDPTAVVHGLVDCLRPGGQLVLVVPSAYHMAYFALKRGVVDQASQSLTKRRGCFTDDMPAIHNFTPVQLAALAQGAGLTDIRVRGFPCLIYPGEAETRVTGSSGEIVELLRDSDTMRRLVEIELRTALQPDTAGRGNNLYLCATKT